MTIDHLTLAEQHAHDQYIKKLLAIDEAAIPERKVEIPPFKDWKYLLAINEPWKDRDYWIKRFWKRVSL